jgi:hypothetical protein
MIKALYKKHLPHLRTRLIRYPENPAGWLNLLRMSQVLDEQIIIRALNQVVWFRVSLTDAATLPIRPLAKAVYLEAKTTRSWKEAKQLLRLLWEQMAKQKVTLLDKGKLLPPEKGVEAEKWSLLERNEVWDQLLAPLIEAMIRSNASAEVPLLLAELDASWKGIGLADRLGRLAQALDRPDLCRAWQAAVRAPMPQLPGGVNFEQDLMILYSGHQSPDFVDDPWRLLGPLEKKGLLVGLSEASAPWCQRLGWLEPSPKWALVTRLGEVLLQGEELPSGAALLREYTASGLATDLETVEAFRKQHPECLAAKAIETRVRGCVLRAYGAVRPAQGTSGPSQGNLTPEGITALRAYWDSLESLLEDPMGMCPGVLRRAQVDLTLVALGEDGAETLGLTELAARVAPRLATALAQRPTDRELWRLWLAFASTLDWALPPFLEVLVPSPLTLPETWPPREVLARAAGDLRRHAKWARIVDLLLPCVESKQAEFLGSLGAKERQSLWTFRPDWPWVLTQPLLEALLRLGRMREADEILLAWMAGGSHPGEYEIINLCTIAEQMEAMAWAQKWRSASAQN